MALDKFTETIKLPGNIFDHVLALRNYLGMTFSKGRSNSCLINYRRQKQKGVRYWLLMRAYFLPIATTDQSIGQKLGNHRESFKSLPLTSLYLYVA